MSNSGGKAKGLEELVNLKDKRFLVPDFDTVDASFHGLMGIHVMFPEQHSSHQTLPRELKSKISDLIRKYKGQKIIIRSSSKQEDGDHSFAGIYDSVVVEEVTQRKVENAFLQVYASFHSQKAHQYRREHDIDDDQMAMIVQQFLEPDYSGVMYSSNPSFPADLSIEFTQGRNKVVEGMGRTNIVDFDKKTGKIVFQSEHFLDVNQHYLKKLFSLGVDLERTFGPLDIEFFFKDDQLYLVQKRKITDISNPVKIVIPKYDPDQCIGKTNIMRGRGKVTLSALVVQDISDLVQNLSILVSFAPDQVEKQCKSWFDQIKNFDDDHPEGYILVLPHFHDTVIGAFAVLPSFNYNTNLDELTPNKKAVVTTKFGSISSHIMTIARERGIAYAGFSDRPDIIEKVDTGDVLSIYFRGRMAEIYRERAQQQGIRERFPQAIFSAIDNGDHGVSFQVDWSIGHYKHILTDLELFLREATEQVWKFKEFDVHMGSVFTNVENKSFTLYMSKHNGVSYTWAFTPSREWESGNPLTAEEIKPIVNQYKSHLGIK